MDIKLYTDYLVHILKSAINKTEPEPIPDGIDENEFLQFCAFHKLENIVYLTIGDKLSEMAQKILSERYNRSVFVSATQQYYLEEVESALNENGIDYLVLKGRELVKLYPSEDMRQSADFDIYLGRENAKKAKDIMLGLGFEILSYTDTDEHDEYIADKVAMCEIHPVLIQNNHPWQTECNRIPERLIKKEEKSHELKMSNEDFYLYNLAHTAKHMKYAGIGIRAFLDMWLIYKNYSDSFNWDYLNEKLKLAKLDEFEKNTRKLCAFWFEGEDADDTICAMALYVAKSGWVGTKEQEKSTALAEAAGNTKSVKAAKLSKMKEMFFAPYSAMVVRYPILKKHKWLLPFCRIHRALRAIIKRRDVIRDVTNDLENGDMQTGKAIVALKQKIGL